MAYSVRNGLRYELGDGPANAFAQRFFRSRLASDAAAFEQRPQQVNAVQILSFRASAIWTAA